MATPATPVVEKKSRFGFKDEGRDILAETLAKGEQARSGDTNNGQVTEHKPDESFLKPQAQFLVPPGHEGMIAPEVRAKTVEAPPVEVPPAEQPVTPPSEPPAAPKTEEPVPQAEQPKLLAGKFKTPEELEKGYTELEKTFHQKAQEAATLKKAAVTPVVDASQTEEQRLERINQFLTDPDKFANDMASKITQTVQASQQIADRMAAWRSTNKDMAPYEKFVAWTMAELVQGNPDLEPWAALEQATTQIRGLAGSIFSAGKKEALSIQSSVTTPAGIKVNTPPPTEQPAKAPMSDQDAHTEHLDFLRNEAARVRRPVR